MFWNSVAFKKNIWYNQNMDKDIYNIKENDLTYGRGYVYSLQYHIVWCTKYRKQILKDGMDEELKQMRKEPLGRTSVEPVLLCSNSQ